MSAIILQRFLLGLVPLLTSMSTGWMTSTGWVASPMSWSADGRWLSYTTAPDPDADPDRRTPDHGPGWLFNTVPDAEGGIAEAPAQFNDANGDYQIWASRRDGEASVLLERSAWPLSTPRWHPRSRSLAFVRFVPVEAVAESSPLCRGRLEVVVRDGLERHRVLTALPGFVLDEAARARFPHVAPCWSPDGQFLAVPVPGQPGSIAIVRVKSGQVIRTIERALLPSWSPDGTRLAFLRAARAGVLELQLLKRQGAEFGSPRGVTTVGQVAAPIGWSSDGRTMLAVVEPNQTKNPAVELRRIASDARRLAPDSDDSALIFNLVPDALRRTLTLRGIAIDFDRDEELCFASADLQGRLTDVAWSIPRDKHTLLRFHPIDPFLRIGSLAIAPDGHAVAMRFGTPDEGLSPPSICELELDRASPSQHMIPIVADATARRAWRDLLIRTSRSLLNVAMAAVVVDNQTVVRPTVLPLPDELAALPPLRSRLAQIGRIGASICRDRNARPADLDTMDLEDRLYFDYLRGAYDKAMTDLEALEDRLTDRPRRLALLSLRAQIFWARGETERARAVAGYLVDAAGGPVHRIEETSAGRSMATESEPIQAWAHFLAQRIASPRPSSSLTSEPNADDPDDPTRNFNPFLGPRGLDLPRIPGDVRPVGPNPQAARQEAIRRRIIELQRQINAQGGQFPPPPPVKIRPR